MRTLVAVAALGLAGCSSTYQHIMEYPGHLPGNYAAVYGDGRQIHVKLHPTDSTILLQSTVSAAAVGGFVSGFTFGLVPTGAVIGLRPDVINAAAQAFFAGSGCTVEQAYQLMDVSWEAAYQCLAGSTPPVIGKQTALISTAPE